MESISLHAILGDCVAKESIRVFFCLVSALLRHKRLLVMTTVGD